MDKKFKIWLDLNKKRLLQSFLSKNITAFLLYAEKQYKQEEE